MIVHTLEHSKELRNTILEGMIEGKRSVEDQEQITLKK